MHVVRHEHVRKNCKVPALAGLPNLHYELIDQGTTREDNTPSFRATRHEIAIATEVIEVGKAGRAPAHVSRAERKTCHERRMSGARPRAAPERVDSASALRADLGRDSRASGPRLTTRGALRTARGVPRLTARAALRTARGVPRLTTRGALRTARSVPRLTTRGALRTARGVPRLTTRGALRTARRPAAHNPSRATYGPAARNPSRATYCTYSRSSFCRRAWSSRRGRGSARRSASRRGSSSFDPPTSLWWIARVRSPCTCCVWILTG